jgi:hypothetical protein
VTVQTKKERTEELVALYKNELIPAGREQPGFMGMWLHLDRKTGKALSVSRWDTEANMLASESGFLARSMAAVAPMIDGEAVTDRYEVVAQS